MITFRCTECFKNKPCTLSMKDIENGLKPTQCPFKTEFQAIAKWKKINEK